MEVFACNDLRFMLEGPDFLGRQDQAKEEKAHITIAGCMKNGDEFVPWISQILFRPIGSCAFYASASASAATEE